MQHYVHIIAIVFGIVSVVYPIYNANKFFRTTRLGNASALVYVGEAIIMAVTLGFSIFIWSGYVFNMSVTTMQLIHIFMFIVCIITSRVLHVILIDITSKENDSK